MKKTLICILAALLVLSCLAGCKDKPEAAASAEATGPQETSILPTAPAEYANPFSDTPPEGDVVVTNLPWGADLRPCYFTRLDLNFKVLSKHPLDTSDFSLTLPIRTEYEASVREIPLIPAPQANDDGIGGNDFPFYLYQIYRGMDWKEYTRLRREVETIDYFSDPEAYEAAQEARNSLALQYWTDFLSLTAKDLPLFYAYEVKIDFLQTVIDGKEIYDEECSHMELHLGDYDTVIEGGSFRIHGGDLPLEPLREGGMAVGVRAHYLDNGEFVYPCGGGIEQMIGVADFDATEDLTLTGFELFESRLEILQLHVTVESDRSGSMDFFWDAQVPVKLKAGDHCVIDAVVRDPLLAEAEERNWQNAAFPSPYDYYVTENYIVRYHCGEEKGTIFGCYYDYPVSNPWELYAVWFDGLDVSSYYKDYYQPCWNAWRDEFKEG